jgi:hypothetical protein
MSVVLVPVFLLLSLGAFAFAVCHARRQARARTAALGGLAARLGWRFHGEEKDEGLDGLYPQFGQFGRGHFRYASNRLSGSIQGFDTELSAEAGDYHYKVASGSGKRSRMRTRRFSYLLVTLPFGPLLPALRVRPEHFWDKAAGAAGFEDIGFESAEFSRRHHVSSDNRRFTCALIDRRMIEFLLGTRSPAFELSAGVLLVVPGGGASCWDARGLEAAIAWAHGFVARWPEHLASDLRTRC